jgi:hypothetical protein
MLSHTTSPQAVVEAMDEPRRCLGGSQRYALIGNAGWAIVALLGSGIVLNSLSHPESASDNRSERGDSQGT